MQTECGFRGICVLMVALKTYELFQSRLNSLWKPGQPKPVHYVREAFGDE